jgi:hypothetical protein
MTSQLRHTTQWDGPSLDDLSRVFVITTKLGQPIDLRNFCPAFQFAVSPGRRSWLLTRAL